MGLNLEPKAAAFLAALDAAGIPPFEAGTPEAARRLVQSLRANQQPLPIAHVSDHVAPASNGVVPLRLYRASEVPAAAIIYLHGGGWVLGGVDESDQFARALAITSGCAVLSVDYRLAPEAPYPAAIRDAEAAFGWLWHEMAGLFGAPLPIILLGDSAGGNLATVLAASIRDRGGPPVAAQVLAYPVTDWAMDTESYALFADGPFLTARLMAWFWDHYIAETDRRSHPSLSPIRGNLVGLPPTFVLTAENDPLRDEGEAYAKALAAAGVPTLARRYDGQVHGFLTFVGMFDGGALALQDIADFIRDTVAKGH